MPHIEIKCFPGRTDEQKRVCAENVAKEVAKTMGCNISSVSVVIKDVEKEDWKSEVWDKQIVTEKECMYKKPGYSYDEEKES